MIYRTIDPIDAGAVPSTGRARIISGIDEFAGRASVVEVVLRRGSEPPRRRHHHEDLLVYVVSGSLTVHVDGEVLPVIAGSALYLPRGCEHAYVVASETARLLLVLSPGGAEDVLTELCAVGEDACIGDASHGETIDRLVAAAAVNGIDITGPAPGAS